MNEGGKRIWNTRKLKTDQTSAIRLWISQYMGWNVSHYSQNFQLEFKSQEITECILNKYKYHT